MPRLGFFASKPAPPKAGPSSPLSRDVDEDDDDWYIPYNGPYEQPAQSNQQQNRDSWGELLNGWLSDEDTENKPRAVARDARGSQAASAPTERTRSRIVSNISRQTQSTGGRATHLRTTEQPRPPPVAFVKVEPSGGVGESPVPLERTLPPIPDPPTSAPQPQLRSASSKRGSLASIFTFGRKSIRLSVSMDNLSHPFKRERSNTDLTSTPPGVTRTNSRGRPRAQTTTAQPARTMGPDEYYNSYYSTLLETPGQELEREEGGSSLRSHPYAYPFPEPLAPEPHSAPAAVGKGKGRAPNPPKISFNLLDPRSASKDIPAYLKPSPRSSLLKASISTPNLRNIPKGKQRWWSAESWCDAIILPRPRFALRFVDPSGSGRIVSPPPSPIMFPDGKSPTMQRRPSNPESKSPKKVKSMGNLMASESAPPQPSEKPRDETPVAGPSNLRPPRPKSFALDDLALPSPVPSLAKVLEEGKQLEEQRRQWQNHASRSFLDKRAGAMSRARSKSIGAAQGRPHGRSREPESTFDFLAERTLLGNQTRPPTIHVRGPSSSGSKGRNRSQSQSQSQTQTQTATQGMVASTVSNMFSRSGSRSQSHAHSNSLGNSVSWKSATNESSGGHSRSQSMGKQALKLVVSTAAGAAALCGLSSPVSDQGPASPSHEKNLTVPGQGPQGVLTRLPDQQSAEGGEGGNVIVISSSSPSAALAMVGTGGVNGMSPTPSALSGSGEGVGVAITLPSDDHSRQQGREPIRLPAHPYAQGFGYQQTAFPPHVYSDASNVLGEEENLSRHRQPVLLHPYSQTGHPYASPGHNSRDVHTQDNTIPATTNTTNTDTNMYAELSPGYISEIRPEDIRYSPDILYPPTVVPPSEPQETPSSGHPYVAASKRTSELGFGEALMNTMRRGSVDSGLGTSESGGFARGIDWERPTVDLSPEIAMNDIVRLHHTPQSSHDYFATRPSFQRQGSGSTAANETTASSPPEHLIPPLFRRTASGASAGRASSKSLLGNSSGSSPGMVSHDSSPPLSPRPINTNEDMERYRDLFYRPSSSSMSDDARRAGLGSRRPSGNSIPTDVSSQSARSALTRSGLSDLARQLSEDLEELRRERGSGVSEADSQHVWGRRFGGLRGLRPEDMDDPNVVLAHLSSSGSPGTFHSPLRLPIDTSFVSPTTNIPEDVESSRASSILELSSIPDDPNELVRMGEVGGATNPSIIASPHRVSTQLSLIEHEDEAVEVPLDDTLRLPRIVSQQSTLHTPLTPNTRSSYMTSNTDGSRMSGLSDFPVPPSEIVPPPMTSSASNLTVPRLLRELSHDTFGRQTDDEYSIVGQAL